MLSFLNVLSIYRHSSGSKSADKGGKDKSKSSPKASRGMDDDKMDDDDDDDEMHLRGEPCCPVLIKTRFGMFQTLI